MIDKESKGKMTKKTKSPMIQNTNTALSGEGLRKARTASIVICCTAVLWLGLQLFAQQLNLAGRYAFLFDFAALAALFWAMVVLYQVRRDRTAQDTESKKNARR